MFTSTTEQKGNIFAIRPLFARYSDNFSRWFYALFTSTSVRRAKYVWQPNDIFSFVSEPVEVLISPTFSEVQFSVDLRIADRRARKTRIYDVDSSRCRAGV